MSELPGKQEARRARLQGWLQTAAFLGAAAILSLVIYTSVVMQQDRRDRDAAATSAPLTARAQELLARRSTPVPRPAEAFSPGNLDRVEELARWGKGGVITVAWSPDGQRLAVGSTVGVYLFDASSVEQVGFLATHSPVAHLSFSPDGQALAVDVAGRWVQVWQLAGGTLSQTVGGFPGPVRTVTFTPDGTLLVAGVQEGDWAVWLWRDGTATFLSAAGEPSTRDPVETVPVAISADGQVLAASGPGGTVRVWRLRDGTLQRIVQGELRYASDPKTVTVLALSPDGRVLAYSLGGWVQVVWLDTGEQAGAYPLMRPVPTVPGPPLEGEQDMYTYGLSLAFSPDGSIVAGGSGDGTLWLWRVAQEPGTLLHMIETAAGPAWSLAFSPAGLLAAALPQVGSVQVWDATDGTLLHSFLGATSWLQTAIFSPNGQSLAVSGLDGRVWLWRIAGGEPWLELQGEETTAKSAKRPIYAVSSLAFSRDGSLLAGGMVDGTVRLWDAANGGLLRIHQAAGYAGAPSSVPGRTIMFTSDGMVLTVIYTSTSGYGPLVRVDDGRILASLVEVIGTQVYLPSVESVAFSPDGLLLAAGSEDNRVWLWRTDTGALLGQLEGHQGPVRAVAFSPDGQLLASASNDGTVRLWNAADLTPRQTLGGHQDWVRGVAFSPDGTLLASASADGTVRLWQVADGAPLRSLLTTAAEAVTFSPDGQVLAVGLADGTVQLWRVSDGAPRRVLLGHTLAVLSVGFSADGALLVSTSHDGTVRLWGVR